jgi:hypothetical protein
MRKKKTSRDVLCRHPVVLFLSLAHFALYPLSRWQ